VPDAHGGFSATKAASGGTRGLPRPLHGKHANGAENLGEREDAENRAASRGGRRVADGVADGVIDGVKGDARTFLRAFLCSVVWSSPA